MAAKDLSSARKTPLVAALPKMFFQAIVTRLGMIALAVAPQIVTKDYNLALRCSSAAIMEPVCWGWD